jgi:hypothetical protein
MRRLYDHKSGKNLSVLAEFCRFELSVRLSRPQKPVSSPSQEKSTDNVKKNSSNLIVGIAIAVANLSMQGCTSILGRSGEVQVRLAVCITIDSKTGVTLTAGRKS